MAERAAILLVDDETTFRTIVARHLRSHGYRVTEAASAEEAAAALRERARPDLVLLDLNLPGDTGWDLLRGDVLRAPDAPPVVVATATPINPRRLAEFRRRRLPAQALPARDPAGHRRPAAQGAHARMTDLQILLIAVACVLALAGCVVLCDRVRG